MWTRHALLLAALAFTTAGCLGSRSGEVAELAEQIVSRDRHISELKRQLSSEEALAADRLAQIRQLQALGPKRIEKLFHVNRIQLATYTGGYDTDETRGDEGVNVYLEPIDAHGSVIKAAGSVKIQLFDLAAAPSRHLIGEYIFGVDELSKHWYGGALTYYFRFECPWRTGPPAHAEVTVRVVFVDYLTGKELTAQTRCPVKLPTERKPAK